MPDANKPPHPLNYAAPSPRRTTVGIFLLRMAIGCVLSFAFGALGVWLASITGIVFLIYVPLGLLTTAAIVLTITRRTYGYLTGIALSLVLGVLIGVALIIFLIVTCKGFGR